MLMAARGIVKPEEVPAFLHPDFKTSFRSPSQLPGCTAAAELLYQRIIEGKTIAVYGDYDVDGITATAIIYKTLKQLGAKNIQYYIPSRIDEGYGLNADAIDKLKADNVDVIITVDCGITSIEEAEHAKQNGIELLITDHHIPQAVLPDAAVIVHPQLVRYPAVGGPIVSPASLSEEQLAEAKQYPFHLLCGAGVALKVAMRTAEIAAKHSPEKILPPELKREILVFAMLATISDFVLLQDENRALVRTGLALLSKAPVSKGIEALLETAKFNREKKKLDEEFVAYQIAPRLNAVGRLGLAQLAAEILISNDDRRIKDLAVEFDKLNTSRKKLQNELVHQITQQVKEVEDEPAFVIEGIGWHRGIIGIAAGRIAEQFYKPVVVFSRDAMGNESVSVGSARSVTGFNLYEALERCSDLFVRFGGHSAAAGVTIENKNIAEFRERLCDIARREIPEEERVGELFIDGEFPISCFTAKAVHEISDMAPFGSGNPRPVFAARNVSLDNVRMIGMDGSHFSAEFVQGKARIRGVAFNRKHWIEEMQPLDTPLDIAFTVTINDFNGRPELHLLDWQRQ